MNSAMWPLFLLLLSSVSSDEVGVRANQLGPRNYNHHARQYLEEVEPTKQGPVLFPNDAPPSPRPPLIVTSRPLAESIAKSDLNPISTPTRITDKKNPEYQNSDTNSIAEQSRLNRVEYKPYRQPSPTPFIIVNAVTGKPVGFTGGFDGYRGLEKVRVISQVGANRFNDYEIKQPAYSSRYQSNRVDDQDDLSQNSNYAFSYKVRDQKTGDDFSHSQQSTGSATNGEYRVRLPDGRMQIVSYTADENGYKADVRYDVDLKKDTDKYSDNTIDYKIIGNTVANNALDGIGNNYEDYHSNIYKYINNNNNNNNDNNDRFYKNHAPVKELYEDDYENDGYDEYLLQYNGKNYYQPHNSIAESKVSQQNLLEEETPNGIEPNQNLKPSIEELRNLFLNRKPLSDFSQYSKIPVEINVPSTTPSPADYDTSSEHVVVIGPTKPTLYTNIRSTLATAVTTPSPLYQRYSTPSFLTTTADDYRKNIDYSGGKPVFSSSFLDRINKYIQY